MANAHRMARFRHGCRARVGLGVALGAALALAGCAGTGTIEGHVRMADGSAKRTVVTAWPAAEITPPRAPGHATAAIGGGQFAPNVLIVSPGVTVAFANHDRVFHMPFSVSPAGPFELGKCAPGSEHPVTFDHPGVVQVYCAIHPREVLYVIVAPDRWHTQPAPDGSFVFANLPYGTYYVRAWHPAVGDVTKRVEVHGPEPVMVTFRH
jgi:plastocyanin